MHRHICGHGLAFKKVISSHPDQGVTVTLRPAIPISLRETPNAVKLRFFASRNAERRKTPVFERSDAQKHVESGGE